MFRRPLNWLIKNINPRTIGMSAFVGLSLFNIQNSYKLIQSAPQIKHSPITQPKHTQISLPQNQSYYLIVYDPSQPQIVNMVKSVLSKQKQKLVFLTIKQYEQLTQEELVQKVTIFYKGNYLPYKIKLDLQKGDITIQSKNIQSFVQILDSSQDLQGLIKQTQNSFDNPLFIINVYNEQGQKVLRDQIIALSQLNILNPLVHKIHIIKRKLQNNEQKSQDNCYHILKNDLLAQITNTYQFQTFKNPPVKPILQDLTQARRQFIQFLLPRIHVIRDVQDYLMFQQRNNLNKQKYTISIKINPHDLLSQQKLKITQKLYQKYKNQFNFVVFATSKFKSFLVHTNKQSDDFILFNTQKTLQSNIQQRLTYQKLLLGNYNTKQSLNNNFNQISQRIDSFLNGQTKAKDYNTIPSEKHFQINVNILQNLIKTKKDQFVLGVCAKKCQDQIRSKLANYWIDYQIHNIGINQQVYLKIDPKSKVIEPIQ